jgi:NPCBM/NEW2 domain/Protein of unknown function (DUF1583) C domain
MHRALLLWASLLVGDVHDYSRPLDAKKLDQATFDAEVYGEKKLIKRENDGLRITLAPGDPETGWKTPQALKIGGDFTITASFVAHKLPKPAQEDGVAVGLSIATQNLDQPDATFVRVTETSGVTVYRSIDKPGNNPQQPQMQMQMQMMMRFGGGGMQPDGKPPKPPRKTFRASGETFRLELRREGPTVRYHVVDGESGSARYIGQVELGTMDIAGVKMFASNRNGAEAVDVVLVDLTVRADRISGLGTEVRTVFGEVIRGEPTAIEDGKLIIGGPPKAPPPAWPASLPANVFAIAETTKPADSPAPVAAKPDPAKPAVAIAVKEPGVTVVKEATGVAVAKEKGPDAKTNAAGAAANASPPPKVEPKARLPLGEVEEIAFERALNLAGRVLGQPNLDFTMPGAGDSKDAAAGAKPVATADDVLAPPPGTVAAKKIPKLEPKPNGICDLHVTLSNLRNVAIKQVMINTQTDKGPTAWRLDTTDSNDWPLLLRRAGTEPWADLFLEPPAGDLNGKALTVNVMYADGQNGNASVQVDKKIDPKLAFDPKAPAPSLDARVYLTGDEQLFGRIEALGAESLRLRTPWGDHLAVPLARVAGIYMGLADHKESTESFARRLRTRGTEDLLLATSKDGEVVAISGIAEGTEGDKLLFHFQDKTRSLPLKLVEGLVLAARPDPERAHGLRPTFSLAGGLVVSGLWKDLNTETWKVETPWGQDLNLPAAEIRGVRFRGGQMTYLSDLEPNKIEETPFFGRRTPWRKDVNLTGGPLKMDGRTYDHGLAVHSRTALTYDLEGQFATFEATVGFDESAKGLGRVDCRVFADDKEVYANPDLRSDASPVKLALSVAKAHQLRLVVDFGADQDTGDRVIWANSRLFRSPPTAAKSADAAQPTRPEPDPAKPRNPKTESGE